MRTPQKNFPFRMGEMKKEIFRAAKREKKSVNAWLLELIKKEFNSNGK